MKFFDETRIPILSKALDAYTLRHKVISSNIANIGTPGYKSKNVDFESTLANAMGSDSVIGAQTNPHHFAIGASAAPQAQPLNVVESNPGQLKNEELTSGINDVDIDSEMAELAKNQILFKYASRLLGESFRGIQKSIRGQA